MTGQRLAPHDAELVEADARRLFEAMAAADGLPISWGDAPEALRVLFRDYARDPITFGRVFHDRPV